VSGGLNSAAKKNIPTFLGKTLAQQRPSIMHVAVHKKQNKASLKHFWDKSHINYVSCQKGSFCFLGDMTF
jgi:hypothetical protein